MSLDPLDRDHSGSRGRSQAAGDPRKGSCGWDRMFQQLGLLHLTQLVLASVHRGVATGAGWFMWTWLGTATRL